MSGGEAFRVNSDLSRIAFGRYVDQMYAEHKDLTFPKPKLGGDRSLDQNSLSHVWYSYADKMLDEPTGTSRCYCKLHFGVPILRAECETFRGVYDTAIRPHSYEFKIQKAIRVLPVTSWMTPKQMTRYLSQVQFYYASEHGLVLESRGEYEKLTRGKHV